MKLNSIRWRLALSYAAIALLAAFSLGIVLRAILRGYYDAQEAQYLQGHAMRIGAITSQLINANIPAELIQDQSASWSFFLQARVRIEDTSGTVIADSGVPDNRQVVYFTSAVPFQIPIGGTVTSPVGVTESFEVQIIRGESPMGADAQGDFVIFKPDSVGVVMPADVSMYGLLDPNADVSTRRSSQVVEQQMVDEKGAALGKLILSDGPAYGDEILNNVMNGWVAAGIVAVLLAALAGWFFSNRITTPITALTQITARMAAGDLTARADILSTDEMGALGHSFNEMAVRVEATVGALRSFVADAAHELHTPLTALQANLELARDEKTASARTQYLARAQEQGQRLEALVKSLLDLSRIEAAESRSTFGSVDVVQLVREAGEQFASRAEQTDRAFTMNIPDDDVHMMGNETQLRQVVSNLLENALKFTPAGGSISLNLECSANEIRLTVSDAGIGIPPEDLSHLFERFHRGRNVSEFTGNGLGLAIVKAIVQSHSGEVEAQSDGVGMGSRFVVILPQA